MSTRLLISVIYAEFSENMLNIYSFNGKQQKKLYLFRISDIGIIISLLTI